MSMLTYDQIVNLSILRQFYQLAWRLFGVNIAIISPDRKRSMAVFSKEGWSPFCVRLREMVGEKHCVDCDRRYAEIVEERHKPLRYHCWAGMTEFIVPIILDNEILAYIQCGQVLDIPPSDEQWDSTRGAIIKSGFDQLPTKELFFSSRVVPTRTQEDLIALLELFSNYIAYAQHQILLAEASQQSRAEERALSFVRNHLTEAISLDDVAKAACTSKRNLSRIFQTNTGMTVLEVIQEMRITKACDLLQSGAYTCMQVALESGFGSVQQFNRVFKKMRHCTPLAWQQQHRQSEKAAVSLSSIEGYFLPGSD
jgi:AraC-like DNA-binding protein/ligand-binding sensor protein